MEGGKEKDSGVKMQLNFPMHPWPQNCGQTSRKTPSTILAAGDLYRLKTPRPGRLVCSQLLDVWFVLGAPWLLSAGLLWFTWDEPSSKSYEALYSQQYGCGVNSCFYFCFLPGGIITTMQSVADTCVNYLQ